MTIQLMKNNSDDIALNKNINFITELKGTLRDRCDLLNPAILIESADYLSLFDTMDVAYNDDILVEYDEFEITANSNNISLFKINYAYIPEFERYYFIDNIEIYNKNLYILYMSVDDLMSHKDRILNENALIERNEFIYDLMLEDTIQPYEFKNDVELIEVDKSSNTLHFGNNSDPTVLAYHVTYLDVYDRFPRYDISNYVEKNLPLVKGNYVGTSNFTAYGVMNIGNINSLCTHVRTNESLATYITSIIAYPFEIPHLSQELNFYMMGDHETPIVIGKYHLPKSNTPRYYLLGKFKIDKTSYLDVEPYSTYEIYLPFVDFVTVKSSDILDCEIRIYYVIDFQNGTGKVIIYNHTKDYIISTHNAVVGVSIPVNRTNAQQINDAKTQVGINIATSTLSGVVAGAIKGGVAGAVVGGVIGAGVSTVKGIETLAFMHQKATASNKSGFEGVYSTLEVFIKKTKYVIKDIDNYNHYYGKPLNKTDKLINYKGYTIVSDIYLDDLDALDKEKEVIKSLLKSGIIL